MAAHSDQSKMNCPRCGRHKFSRVERFKLCVFSGSCPNCNGKVKVITAGWYILLTSIAAPFIVLFLLFSDLSPVVLSVPYGVPIVVSVFLSVILVPIVFSGLYGLFCKISAIE